VTIITESDKDDGYFLNCPKTAELYTEDLKFYQPGFTNLYYVLGVDPGFGPNPKNPGNSKNSEPE